MVQVTHKKQKRSVVIGMVLGSSYIHRNGNLSVKHCLNQMPYLQFKMNLLQENQIPELKIQEFVGYSGCKLETRIRPIYKSVRRKLYKHGLKQISRQTLDYLDDLGIAIWFQDNGSISVKKRAGRIHACEITLNTYCSKEENEIIISYFKEVWNIQWGLSTNKCKYRLRMGTKEGRKLVKIVKPYIVPCMFYKIQPLCL